MNKQDRALWGVTQYEAYVTQLENIMVNVPAEYKDAAQKWEQRYEMANRLAGASARSRANIVAQLYQHGLMVNEHDTVVPLK